MRESIAQLIIDEVAGTPTNVFFCIDKMLEDGTIDREEYRVNEVAILHEVDCEMFECSCCGWNCWISEMSEEDELCNNCAGDSQ